MLYRIFNVILIPIKCNSSFTVKVFIVKKKRALIKAINCYVLVVFN